MTTTKKTDDEKADAKIAPAKEFEASGAPHQPSDQVDPAHPAVDNNPRERTTLEQNRIDFNDPTLSGAAAVAHNLAAQDKV